MLDSPSSHFGHKMEIPLLQLQHWDCTHLFSEWAVADYVKKITNAPSLSIHSVTENCITHFEAKFHWTFRAFCPNKLRDEAVSRSENCSRPHGAHARFEDGQRDHSAVILLLDAPLPGFQWYSLFAIAQDRCSFSFIFFAFLYHVSAWTGRLAVLWHARERVWSFEYFKWCMNMLVLSTVFATGASVRAVKAPSVMTLHSWNYSHNKREICFSSASWSC